MTRLHFTFPPMDRRRFMQAAGAAVVAMARPASGHDTPRPRLVLVSLQGGLDGLAAVPPLGDPDYRAARGALALTDGQPEGAIGLNGFFSLHRALAPLGEFYRRGELLAVHAIGHVDRSKPVGHDEARRALGGLTTDAAAAETGWLYRALDRKHPCGALPVFVADETDLHPLRGPRAATWRAPEPDDEDRLLDAIAELPRGDRIFADALRSRGYVGSSGDDFVIARQRRHNTAFLHTATAAGIALAAPDGPQAAVLSLSGWDTHEKQGTGQGRLATALTGLAEGLAALAAASGEAWRDTVVVIASEFGRTVAPNATGGTDHGTATATLLLGGAVAGGRVIGDWPGLAADRLTEGGGLAPTTDWRALFKGLLVDHLGIAAAVADERVFPASASVPALTGLIRLRDEVS